MKRLNAMQIARKMQNDFLLTVGAKILEKLILCTCEKLYDINFALYLATDPSML